MDIVEFLAARITEDETLAQIAIDGHPAGDPWQYLDVPVDGEHITHWSPWRVMSACVAKRLTLAAHRRVVDHDKTGTTVGCEVCGRPADKVSWPCYTLRVLALEYADHRDYRYDWRPHLLRVLR
jgi:hypothetical protein